MSWTKSPSSISSRSPSRLPTSRIVMRSMVHGTYGMARGPELTGTLLRTKPGDPTAGTHLEPDASGAPTQVQPAAVSRELVLLSSFVFAMCRLFVPVPRAHAMGWVARVAVSFYTFVAVSCMCLYNHKPETAQGRCLPIEIRSALKTCESHRNARRTLSWPCRCPPRTDCNRAGNEREQRWP